MSKQIEVGVLLKAKLKFPVSGPDVEIGDYCLLLSLQDIITTRYVKMYTFLHIRTKQIEYLDTNFFDVYFDVVKS